MEIVKNKIHNMVVYKNVKRLICSVRYLQKQAKNKNFRIAMLYYLYNQETNTSIKYDNYWMYKIEYKMLFNSKPFPQNASEFGHGVSHRLIFVKLESSLNKETWIKNYNPYMYQASKFVKSIVWVCAYYLKINLI